MENSRSAAYAAAGVDITAGYEGVRLMRDDVKRTHISGVVSDIGGFGGLFAPDVSVMSEPVLVSGTDGVGTKLRLAELMGKHDTIGIDCVAMCVNDVICCGAKPLFFLDYIAIGKNVPEKVASIVSGVAEGCVQAGCALIGGETAEHPGMMAADDYDLAGFTVGLVDKPKVIDSGRMAAGDVVLALPSSGFHSNGYSLVRKVFDVENTDLNRYYDELGETLGEALLRPTVIYVKPVLRCIDAADVRGVSHITGGGFYENIPRCIPDGLCARIDKAAIRTPAVFGLLQAKGGIDEQYVQHLQHGRGHGRRRQPRDRRGGARRAQGRGHRRLRLRRDRHRRRKNLSMLKQHAGKGEDLTMNKAKIAVLVSGGGTNLQALIDAQAAGTLAHGEITLVVSSNEGAYALTRAANAGIRAQTISPKQCGGQAAFETALSALLAQQEIDLIVLAGFLTILSADFTARWPSRILNVHPSLIPAFCGKGMYGLKVHEVALRTGVKVTGATVHFVNEIPDGGRILLQKAVEVLPDDTPETLQRRVMEQAEWQLLPQAAELVSEQIVKEKRNA